MDRGIKKFRNLQKGGATVNSKKLLCIACLIFIVLGISATLWAQGAAYNRPNPAMDYVPQEIGIYDTMYYEHAEHNCRKCHGNSTADRHHGVPQVVRDHICITCHPTCTSGVDPDCENNITIHRNCLTTDCHSWADVQFGNQKWHHNTDMADSENCIACHDPNLIEEITPFRDFEMYPPTVVTPTPFSCENCHWEQKPATSTGNANIPGHPSTYYHEDDWGNPITCPPNGQNCLWEYGKGIWNNMDTHHMDFVGEVATECYKCHSTDPDNPSWDPTNPELIRYCQICHSMRTLHDINHITPHVADHDGWRPVGFHAGGGGANPTTYAKWGPTPYTPQVNPGYTDNMQCFGCHGDDVPDWIADPVCDPAIDSIEPIAGSCGMIVTIRGTCFGEEHIDGREVRMQLKPLPNPWVNVPIHAWTDTMIEIEIPCWTFTPGNYNVQVQTENGNSNKKVFSVKGHPTLLSITPTSGACSEWITLTGNDFGNAQNQWLDNVPHYYGVKRIVDFVASNGEFTATNYRNWSDSSLEVRVYNWFKDQVDTCSINPLTGQNRMERNFVQDIGDEAGDVDTTVTCDNTDPLSVADECALEPLIPRCDCFAIGTYSIYVKAIYYGDEDGSGGLSCGDIIYQVEMSDPRYFELTNEPYIFKLNPKQVVDDNIPPLSLLKVYGGNYGPTKEVGDAVRIGSKAQANSLTLGLGTELATIKIWSDALIKTRLKPNPDSWRGKTKYVWVEKDGMKSNSKPLHILAP